MLERIKHCIKEGWFHCSLYRHRLVLKKERVADAFRYKKTTCIYNQTIFSSQQVEYF
jgi:hypothetical protein